MGTDLQPTTGERDEEWRMMRSLHRPTSYVKQLRAAANVSAIAKLKSKFLQWLEI